MPLVTIQDLSIRYRGPALLDGVDCLIEPGQRIGLLGRNGAGKTTFMKILAGQVEPDHGTVALASGARIALLPQDVPNDLSGTVAEVVRGGVAAHAAFADATGATAAGTAGVQEMEYEQTWEIDHKVDQILSRMALDPEAQVATMSSGLKRRVLLARALVDSPDLLLLDEPTNHLDIDAIRWLEEFLARWDKAYMFITHDRQFLRNLATRILEIDGGRLFDWTCDYETFLRRKEEALAAQEKQDALFDKKLAEEEAWIRQGIKARRTRNEGRVRALKELRNVRSERREKVGTSNLQIQEASRSGTLVARLENISFAHQRPDGSVHPIVQGLSSTIMRGDKVGIVGPNGAGKTTLLKLLLGQLEPQSGSVKLGTNLEVAYFDQLRQQLNEDRTVEEDVADGYQTVKIGDSSRHVLGYLQDFLFTPQRARTPIRQLSGGERNRVLLAKLFAKPANVIVLDEPTNDLDAETLEMLEERLVEYSGTLLMVSHDREFLNNVVSSTMVFERIEDGTQTVREYIGGYDDWLRQYQQRQEAEAKRARSAEKTQTPDSAATTGSAGTASSGNGAVADKPKRKLSFKEQKELDQLPGEISRIEERIAEIHGEMAEPEFYKSAGEAIAAKQAELTACETRLAERYSRWESLEETHSS